MFSLNSPATPRTEQQRRSRSNSANVRGSFLLEEEARDGTSLDGSICLFVSRIWHFFSLSFCLPRGCFSGHRFVRLSLSLSLSLSFLAGAGIDNDGNLFAPTFWHLRLHLPPGARKAIFTTDGRPLVRWSERARERLTSRGAGGNWRKSVPRAAEAETFPSSPLFLLWRCHTIENPLRIPSGSPWS